MNIEVLLTEAEIATEFAEAMEARDLPEKFFYWTALSVAKWKECEASDDDSLHSTWQALASKAKDLVKAFPSVVPVISLGAGTGNRDRGILKALVEAGREVNYFPVDASQTLLETACDAAESEECGGHGIKADISSPVHLMLAADVSEAPRLFLFAGNVLGGFDPMDQIRHVASVIQKGDILILDGRIHDGTLGDSEAEKAFAFAPLASVGLTTEDGDVRFAENEDDRHRGLHLITRRFQAGRDLRMMVSGKEIHVERGERIFLNFQYRFTREALRWLVAEHAGLKVVGEIPSADGRFVTMICSK